MRKYFNTAGPCNPQMHYMLPTVERIPGACNYIAHGEYFVLHATRPTGKTTSLADLTRQLTAAGTYLALHFSCEAASSFAHDVGATEEGRRRSTRPLPGSRMTGRQATEAGRSCASPAGPPAIGSILR